MQVFLKIGHLLFFLRARFTFKTVTLKQQL